MLTYADITPQEIGRRGREIYNRDIRPHVEADNIGKFLILDINTGEYEIDSEDLVASKRLLERVPDGILYGVRVGYRTAYTMAGHMQRERPQ